jgi:hypothetical protein
MTTLVILLRAGRLRRIEEVKKADAAARIEEDDRRTRDLQARGTG